jgi:hypothetical protein
MIESRAMLRSGWSAVAGRRDFRLAVAIFFVALHLLLLTQMASLRLAVPFNTAPGAAPKFQNVAEPLGRDSPRNWNRLAVSRFDAQHYIALALRGNTQCPSGDLRKANLGELAKYCGFGFYPGYPLIGRVISFGNRIPIDYVLFGISILASVTFLYLWTSPVVMSALGAGVTYLALFLFNVFPTGFTLVTVQTEPTVLALSLGAFLTLPSRKYFLGAVLAGAASAVRVSGAATSAAFGIALVASAFVDRPTRWRGLLYIAAAALLSGWGLFLTVGYFAIKYSDPFLYFHTHAAIGRYLEVAASGLSPEFVYRTLETPMRPGIWIAFCLLWMALGLRVALSSFEPVTRAFAWSFTLFGSALPLLGSSNMAFLGMNRYWLFVFPLFWAIAVLVKTRPVAAALWIAICAWAYWNVDLCVYVCQGDGVRLCRLSR